MCFYQASWNSRRSPCRLTLCEPSFWSLAGKMSKVDSLPVILASVRSVQILRWLYFRFSAFNLHFLCFSLSLTSWQRSFVESCLRTRPSTASRECPHTQARAVSPGPWTTLPSPLPSTGKATSNALSVIPTLSECNKG